MKKVIGIIGIISALSVISGVLFKLNHWPGAGILLAAGLILISILIFPAMGYFDMKNSCFKLRPISGYLAAMLLSLATLFKIMHWPGSHAIYSLGLFLLIIVFIPLYTIRNYKTAENKLLAISKSLIILAGVAIFMGLLPTNNISSEEKQASQNKQTEVLTQNKE